jgi:hypothetical protein
VNAWSWIGWSLVAAGSYIAVGSLTLAWWHAAVERRARQDGDPYDVWEEDGDA